MMMIYLPRIPIGIDVASHIKWWQIFVRWFCRFKDSRLDLWHDWLNWQSRWLNEWRWSWRDDWSNGNDFREIWEGDKWGQWWWSLNGYKRFRSWFVDSHVKHRLRFFFNDVRNGDHFRQVNDWDEGWKWRRSCWQFAIWIVHAVGAAVLTTSAVLTAVWVVGAVQATELSSASVGAAVGAWTAIRTTIDILSSINTTEWTWTTVNTLNGDFVIKVITEILIYLPLVPHSLAPAQEDWTWLEALRKFQKYWEKFKKFCAI